MNKFFLGVTGTLIAAIIISNVSHWHIRDQYLFDDSGMWYVLRTPEGGTPIFLDPEYTKCVGQALRRTQWNRGENGLILMDRHYRYWWLQDMKCEIVAIGDSI